MVSSHVNWTLSGGSLAPLCSSGPGSPPKFILDFRAFDAGSEAFANMLR